MAWTEVQPVERTFEVNDGTDTWRVKITAAGLVTLFRFVDGSFQPQGGSVQAPSLAFVKQLFNEVGPLLP